MERLAAVVVEPLVCYLLAANDADGLAGTRPSAPRGVAEVDRGGALHHEGVLETALWPLLYGPSARSPRRNVLQLHIYCGSNSC